MFIYYENIASLQLFPIRIIFSAGLYRRGISPNNNLSSPRNNRYPRGRIEIGICVGVQVTSVARANNETGVHHFTLHTFSISNKYLEAKRSVYTKEVGHFGGLPTRARGIGYSTLSPPVHFRYSSRPGWEGVILNQRCPTSCKPTLDHKK